MKILRSAPAMVIVAALALAGCSDDSTTETTGGSTTTSGAAAGAGSTTATTAVAATDDTVRLLETDYGSVLAGGDGKVFYAFTQDSRDTSTCVSDGCVQKWPPVTVDGEITVGAGLEPGLFGTITRPDGTTQLTIDGKPLYTMTDDRPGTTLCQGADGSWWLVNADGSLNQGGASGSTGGSGNGGSGAAGNGGSGESSTTTTEGGGMSGYDY